MIFSTIVALTLTPALCVMILRRTEKKTSPLFDKFKDNFKSLLEIFMRRKIFMIIVLIAVTAGSFALNKILPSEYIPDEDKGAFYVAVRLPEGTSMNHTIDTLNNFSVALKKIRDIENISVVASMGDTDFYDILSAVNNAAANSIP